MRSTRPDLAAEATLSPAPKSRWWLRILLLVVSLLLAMVLGEVIVRAYSAVAFPRMMKLDDRLGWRHRADCEKAFANEDGESHLYVQDAYGHRPLPETLRSPERTTNVMVLGDSFTEATQVAGDEVYTALLAEMDPTLNVINTGVGAYGTVQQYLYLRDESEAFDPDLVLLVAYENDLTDNCMSHSPRIGPRPWATLDGDVVRIHEGLDDDEFAAFVAPVPFKMALIRHSYLFYAFNDRLWRGWNFERLYAMEEECTERHPSPKTRAIFLELVDRIHELSHARGAAFALVLIPSNTTVQAGGDPWHEEVAEHAAASGFGCLSLLPALSAPDAERAYFERDIHWTSKGHRIAADAILPLVQEALASRE